MRRGRVLLAAMLPCLFGLAQAPSSAQAVALVKQALAFAQQNGTARLIAETNSPQGRFHVSRGDEPSLFIYDKKGTARAFGYQAEAVADRNLRARREPDGVMILQKLLRIAGNLDKGWVDYKYPNPATNLLEQMTTYYEFYGDLMIGCGIPKEAN
jgi:cytochrome c